MSAPTFDLGYLHGGLRMPRRKDKSNKRPIQHVPVPQQLIIPITQHVGDPAQVIVGIGERVLKGTTNRRIRRPNQRSYPCGFVRQSYCDRAVAGVAPPWR